MIEFRPRSTRIWCDSFPAPAVAPAGASPPTFPDVGDLDQASDPGHRLLADVLDDALDHLTIRWE